MTNSKRRIDGGVASAERGQVKEGQSGKHGARVIVAKESTTAGAYTCTERGRANYAKDELERWAHERGFTVYYQEREYRRISFPRWFMSGESTVTEPAGAPIESTTTAATVSGE